MFWVNIYRDSIYTVCSSKKANMLPERHKATNILPGRHKAGNIVLGRPLSLSHQTNLLLTVGLLYSNLLPYSHILPPTQTLPVTQPCTPPPPPCLLPTSCLLYVCAQTTASSCLYQVYPVLIFPLQLPGLFIHAPSALAVYQLLVSAQLLPSTHPCKLSYGHLPSKCLALKVCKN